MTTQELADGILALDEQGLEDLADAIYNNVDDKEEFVDILSLMGIDVSGWCKKKHPTV